MFNRDHRNAPSSNGESAPSHDGPEENPQMRLAMRRKLIQRRAAGAGRAPAKAPAPTGSGAPLPGGVRDKMESSLGADFADVRVHQGPQAESMGAVAYAQGQDVHFKPGAYDPESSSGQRLLGHELAHVVQQRAGRVSVPQGKGMPVNEDPSLEAEADAAGDRAARGEPAHLPGARASGGGSAIQHMKLVPVNGGKQFQDVDDVFTAPYDAADPIVALYNQYVEHHSGKTPKTVEELKAWTPPGNENKEGKDKHSTHGEAQEEEKRVFATLAPTFDLAEICAAVAKTDTQAIGHQLEAGQESLGQKILNELINQNPDALTPLGVGKLLEGFDPRKVEWGLGRLKTGKLVIVRGRSSHVSWDGPLADATPLAHTHTFVTEERHAIRPITTYSEKKKNESTKGEGNANEAPQKRLTFMQLVEGCKGDLHLAEYYVLHLFPTYEDLKICAERNVAMHLVPTPYFWGAEGQIVNPTELSENPKAQRIDVVIEGAKLLKPGSKVCEAKMTLFAGQAVFSHTCFAHPAKFLTLNRDVAESKHNEDQSSGAKSEKKSGSPADRLASTVAELVESGQVPQALQQIHSAEPFPRQLALENPILIGALKRVARPTAVAIVCAMMEGHLEHGNPGLGGGSQFPAWLMESVEGNGEEEAEQPEKMNCWEAVLFGASKLGYLDKKKLNEIYFGKKDEKKTKKVSAQEANEKTTAEVWGFLHFSSSLPQATPQLLPSAGDILFFTKGSRPDHVAISLGGRMMMSLWDASHGHDGFTLLDALSFAEKQGLVLQFGHAPW